MKKRFVGFDRDKKEVAVWGNRIRIANKFRENYYKKNWDRIVDMYNKGKYFTANVGDTDKDKTKVEMLYILVRATIPGLYYRDPTIFLKPNNEESEDAVRPVEALANWEYEQMKMRTTMKRCILDNLLVGHSWVKTGYLNMGKEEMLKTGNFSKFLRPKSAYSVRVPWIDMFGNFYEAKCYENLRWLAQRFYRTIDEIKATKRFNNVDIEEGKMVTAVDDDKKDLMGDLSRKDSSDFRRVMCFEIWDRQKQEVYITAHGAEKYLYKGKFQRSDHPFNFLALEEASDSFFPLSPGSKVESEMLNLNRTRTQRLNHTKRQKTVILYDSEMASETIEDIRDSDNMSLIPVEGLSDMVKDGEKPVMFLDMPAVHGDIYQSEGDLKNSIRETWSLPEYQSGQQVKGVNTAYEASLINNAMRLRTDDKMTAINDFIKNIVNKHIEIFATEYKSDRIIPYENMYGKREFINVKGKLKGDFQAKVDVGEGIPDNNIVRREQAMKLLQIIAQHPDFDEVPVLRYTFSTFGLGGLFEKIYSPGGEPAGAPGTPAAGYNFTGSQNKEGQPRQAGGPEEVEPAREAITKAAGSIGGGAQ